MSTSFPCSPYQALRSLVYFPRMLDKIRLHAAGKLPEAYHPSLGEGFDARCVKLLGVTYDAVTQQVAAGGTDDRILDWCLAHGRGPTDDECEIWSGFMAKRGWRDEASDRIVARIKESRLEHLDARIETMFDFLDFDEGRTPPDFSHWQAPRLSDVIPLN